MAEAREIAGSGPTYVTYDIDFVDPTFAPAPARPRWAGRPRGRRWKWRGACAGWTSWAPIWSRSHPSMLGTAWLGVSLMFEMLCAMAEAVVRAR